MGGTYLSLNLIHRERNAANVTCLHVMVHKLPNDENIGQGAEKKYMGPSKQKMLSAYNINIVCELKKYLNTLFPE